VVDFTWLGLVHCLQCFDTTVGWGYWKVIWPMRNVYHLSSEQVENENQGNLWKMAATVGVDDVMVCHVYIIW